MRPFPHATSRPFAPLLPLILMLGVLTVTADSVDAQDSQQDSQQPSLGKSPDAPQWAIAIHGGAGSNPAGWTEQERMARKAGMREALQTGIDLLRQDTAAIDTVEAVIRVMEDNAVFNAGRGAVLTQQGTAELDASIMDGKTLQCGAVASVTRIKNPIIAARHVMNQTPHVLLVGDGAEQFARQQQLELVPPEYFLSRRGQWLQPAAGREATGSDASRDESKGDDGHFGTVGCVVLDKAGNLAAGTSTGGTEQKLPGRVGDSPIVGAGTYAANGSCAVSGTGRGEEYIRHAVAYDISAQMRYAERSLEDAVTRVMQQTLKPGTGGVITVSHQGEIVMQHNTPGMNCAAADSTGRLEVHLSLRK